MELEQSGWLDGLKVRIKVPHNSRTTLSNRANRIIDFMLVSIDIFHIVTDLKACFEVPWLHLGLTFKISTRVREFHVTMQKKPVALPMDIALRKWNSLNDYERLEQYNDAKVQATKVLSRQRKRTGVAILGRPIPALSQSLELSGEARSVSLRAGEHFSLASLTGEILVLALAGCSYDTKYLGRGQYP